MYDKTATLITGSVAIIYVIDAGVQVGEQIDKVRLKIASRATLQIEYLKIKQVIKFVISS